MTTSHVAEAFRLNHKHVASQEAVPKISWDRQSATSSDTVRSNGSTDVGEWLTIKSSTGSINNSAKTSPSGKIRDGAPDAATGETKLSLGAKSTGRMESCESMETNIVTRASTSNCASDGRESLTSSANFHCGNHKPHKANDKRWKAIQAVKDRDGALGLKHFNLVKSLGHGDIGSVYLAELKGSNCYFAMKVMEKSSLAARNMLPRAQTEREVLELLDHPFLPTLYTHFDTEKYSCLVMEFCTGGDLHTLRQSQPGKHFTESAARFYASEVLIALEYLHMMGVVYRDLKPENVLVREDGHVMISDFDLSMQCVVSPTLVKDSWSESDPRTRTTPSRTPASIHPACLQPSCFIPKMILSRMRKVKFDKPKVSWLKSEDHHQVSVLPELIAEPTEARSMSFVGTHEYLAPEIIKGEGHGSAVDWWTFGVFLYELVYGKTPFKGAGNRATIFNVVRQPLKFPEISGMSPAGKDLIRGLLVKEPMHRLACRRGAGEIKQHQFFEGVNWALIRCTAPPGIPKPFELEVTHSRRDFKEEQLPQAPVKAKSETPPQGLLKEKAIAENNNSDALDQSNSSSQFGDSDVDFDLF